MKPALLVIDMLNDFVKGSLKVPEAEAIIPKIKELIDACRVKGVPVVYVCDSHVKGVDKELEIWGPHAVRGSWGAEVVDELKPTPNDFVVLKRRYSGFFETDLDLLLRELGVETVVLTGVATEICVQHTAADAFFRGYRVIVVKDATAGLTRESHERALEYMRHVYKAEVLSTEEAKSFINALE